MIKNKFFFLLLLFFSLRLCTQAQSDSLKTYIILTIVDSFKITMHAKETYYYIMPVIDSVKPSFAAFCPLYTYGILQNDFDECCDKSYIAPLLNKIEDTVYLSNNYLTEVDELKTLVLKNRKQVEMGIRQFGKRSNTEVIFFYLTPVKGKVCFCRYINYVQHVTGYEGNLAVPRSKFEPVLDFWKSEKAGGFYDIEYRLLDFHNKLITR